MILAKRPRSDYPLQGMYSDKTLIQKIHAIPYVHSSTSYSSQDKEET